MIPGRGVQHAIFLVYCITFPGIHSSKMKRSIIYVTWSPKTRSSSHPRGIQFSPHFYSTKCNNGQITSLSNAEEVSDGIELIKRNMRLGLLRLCYLLMMDRNRGFLPQVIHLNFAQPQNVRKTKLLIFFYKARINSSSEINCIHIDQKAHLFLTEIKVTAPLPSSSS